MHLFLDTEFTDANLLKAELISLALVSEDGVNELYLERNPLPGRCSAFVRANVCPLLDRGSAAVPDVEFTRRLRAFLRKISEHSQAQNHSPKFRPPDIAPFQNVRFWGGQEV